MVIEEPAAYQWPVIIQAILGYAGFPLRRVEIGIVIVFDISFGPEPERRAGPAGGHNHIVGKIAFLEVVEHARIAKFEDQECLVHALDIFVEITPRPDRAHPFGIVSIKDRDETC